MKHNSSVKEQSLHPTSAAIAQPRPAHKETQPTGEIDERVLMALHAAAEKKAIDTVVLDLREIASFTDFFVIVSGAMTVRFRRFQTEVSETLKKNGQRRAGRRI